MIWELLLDHLGSVILSIIFIFSLIFGKPETAEQVQKALEKKQSKLKKKESKLMVKSEKLLQKLVDVSEEIEVINSKKGG